MSAAGASSNTATNDTQKTPIYRLGGTNPSNLTPKGKDILAGNGLSFSTIPSSPCAVTTIEDLQATGLFIVVQDGPTHISVYPVGGLCWIG